ncbi:hypothetical protein AG1IA_00817 [Rhizoctonia solani AG-1 IA]|uniref:Uncharacterized protein n=1 Tax=Thanatephorus cucumeris (strain AG1-IA) TaxID=983506 RepID=L8X7U8_THACA|nr:hypothetical protein AG1IA_00817 [Rhizoctonia solani AG-1 IA]
MDSVGSIDLVGSALSTHDTSQGGVSGAVLGLYITKSSGCCRFPHPLPCGVLARGYCAEYQFSDA